MVGGIAYLFSLGVLHPKVLFAVLGQPGGGGEDHDEGQILWDDPI